MARVWVAAPNKLLKIVTGTTAAYILIIALSVPLIYLFGFRDMRFFLVPSSSMEPTLLRRDYLMSLRQSQYERGDVVILEDPQEPGAYLVKRLVARGGDTVTVAGGALLINQRYVSEPYLMAPPHYQLNPVTIPRDHVFILGDNRDNSDDSHVWGAAPENAIVGKVVCIYYPYDRAGRVKNHFTIMPEPSTGRTTAGPSQSWTAAK